MKIVSLALMGMVAAAASGDVVIQMPAVSAASVPAAAAPIDSSPASSVSPLQRFARGEPAKDRAGNVIQYYVLPSANVGGGGYGGYGYGGYGFGWGGFGWASWDWGYPFLMSPCCNPCESQQSSGWRGRGVSIGL